MVFKMNRSENLVPLNTHKIIESAQKNQATIGLNSSEHLAQWVDRRPLVLVKILPANGAFFTTPCRTYAYRGAKGCALLHSVDVLMQDLPLMTNGSPLRDIAIIFFQRQLSGNQFIGMNFSSPH